MIKDNKMNKIIVAVDGFSSCGKSTIAKAAASAFKYIYIDTGAMYRTVTLYAMREGMISGEGDDKTVDKERLQQAIDAGKLKVDFTLDPETNKPLARLNGEVVEGEIRGLEVSNNVSNVSAIPFVREFLTSQQREMGKEKGIVMDGRDIGTVVFPDAELKLFVTASPEVRAQRRYDELQRKGDTEVKYEDVLKNIQERDYLDTHRELAPLKQADDAIVIDNSNLTIAEQDELVSRYVQEAIDKANK